MRTVILSITLVTFGIHLTGAVHAVLPGCCSNVATITEADPASGAIQRVVTTGPLPGTGSQATNFVVSPDGTAAYILTFTPYNTNAGALIRIALPSGQVTASYSADFEAFGIALNPKLHLVYVTYTESLYGPDILAALDATTLAPVTSVTGVIGGTQIGVAPSGKYLYLGQAGGSGFAILNASTLKTVASVPIVGGGVPVVSPDGSKLYVAASAFAGSASIVVLSAATLQITQTIPIGPNTGLGPTALSPDGTTLYIAENIEYEEAPYYIGALNLQTLILSSVSVPFLIGSLSVSREGADVFIGANIDVDGQSGIAVYNGPANSISTMYNTIGSVQVALNPAGTVLYELSYSSGPVAATSSVPSETIIKTTSGAFEAGPGAYDAEDNLILLSASGDQLGLYSGTSLSLEKIVGFPSYVGAPLVFSGTGYVFGVSDSGSPSIYQFSPSTTTILNTLNLPGYGDYSAAPTGEALSPDGKSLYVAVTYALMGDDKAPSGFGTITDFYVIDTSTMTVVTTWVPPSSVTGAVAVSGNGTTGYYVGLSENETVFLVECDLLTGAASASVQIANPSMSIASNPVLSKDGSVVYLAAADHLYAFNAQTLAIEDQVATSTIGGLSLTPDGGTLYASGPTGYSLFAVPSLAAIGTIAGDYPQPAIFVGK